MTSLRADALSERLFKGMLQTLELSHVWLGDRLGLYAALVRPARCPRPAPGRGAAAEAAPGDRAAPE
jgi:hypothetical protein